MRRARREQKSRGTPQGKRYPGEGRRTRMGRTQCARFSARSASTGAVPIVGRFAFASSTSHGQLSADRAFGRLLRHEVHAARCVLESHVRGVRPSPPRRSGPGERRPRAGPRTSNTATSTYTMFASRTGRARGGARRRLSRRLHVVTVTGARPHRGESASPSSRSRDLLQQDRRGRPLST